MMHKPHVTLSERFGWYWRDFLQMAKYSNYPRGFFHGVIITVSTIAALTIVIVATPLIVQASQSVANPPASSTQYYLLNNDGTIKAATAKDPSGSYFQDEELSSTEVSLGYSVATYTSPDGVEHRIDLKIFGKMDVEHRIQLYNQLVQDGEMEPVKAGAKLASLTEYLNAQLIKLDKTWPSATVAPMIRPIGQQIITIGSDELVQSFREGVKPEDYKGAPYGVIGYQFACQQINLGVENGKQYLDDLKKEFKPFSEVWYTMDVQQVLSKTTEPCDIIEGFPQPPGSEDPSVQDSKQDGQSAHSEAPSDPLQTP